MIETSTTYVFANDMERLLRQDSSVTLIDARTPEEFAAGHVPDAINVPIAELDDYAKRHRNMPAGIVTTMCGSTGRGEKASTILLSHGIANVQVMKGGLKAWREAGFLVA